MNMTLDNVSGGLRTNADYLDRIDMLPVLANHLRNAADAIDAIAARGPGSEYEAGHTHGWAECVEAITHSHAVVSPVVTEVLLELDRATKKFPTWPDDPLHAVGVLNEEVGELNKAVLQQVYEPHKNTPGAMRSEAVQAAAMALRFINSIDRYVFAGGSQHEQNK